MKPNRKNPLLAAALLTLTAPAAFAASQNWDGGSVSNGNWTSVDNWNGAIPGSTVVLNSADVATFNAAILNTWGSTALIPVVINSTTQNIGGINFNGAAGAYFIGSTGGNALLLSSGGEIQRNTGITGTGINQTINAPLIIQGANGTYAINNKGANSGVGSGTLTIGGSISGGAAGATVLSIGGNNTQANTISGVISNGTATTLAVTKGSAGLWVLTNAANLYSGDTTISAGTLRADLGAAYNTLSATPFGTSTIKLNGGTLDMRMAGTLNGTAEDIAIGNNVVVGGSATLNANRAGASSSNKVYTMGSLSIGAFTLSATEGNNYAYSFTSTTLTGNATFNPTTATGSRIILGAVGENAAGRTLTKTGQGVIVLSGTSNYTGATSISGGTFSLTGSLTGGGAISTSSTGFLSQTSTGVISGASTFTQGSSVTSTLAGANTFTGATNINAGILTINNANALGGNNPGVNGTSGINLVAGATLRDNFVGGTANIYAPITLSGTGNATIMAGGLTGTATDTNIVAAIGGTITGNLVFTTVALSQNNNVPVITLGSTGTYTTSTGNTIITAAQTNNNLTVKSGALNSLATSTVLDLRGSPGSNTSAGRVVSFDLNGNNQTLAGLTNSTADHGSTRKQTVTNSAALATLTINNTADFSYGGQTTDAEGTGSAQITGNIALTKSGAGTFTLGGVLGGTATTANALGNSFTGDTNITAGILVLGVQKALQNSAFDTGTSVAGGAADGLRTSVTALTLGGLKGGNDFSTRFTTTTGGYDGLTALTLNPGTGITHTYSGDVGDGATGMTLTKTGAGTQVLSGTNSHTGATAVNAGTLAVDGNISTSNVTVSGTGATLKGSGSIGGTVTIGNLGTLATGNSIESLAVGDLSFTTGSNFQYELDKDAAAGVAGDLTAVTGNLSLTGTVNLSFLETGSGAWELGSPLGDHFGGPPADKLTLISYTGTWNNGLFRWAGFDVLDDSAIVINGQQWWFNYNDTDAGTNFTGDLTGTSFVTMTVPEPNVAVLLGGLGTLALLRRRRN